MARRSHPMAARVGRAIGLAPAIASIGEVLGMPIKPCLIGLLAALAARPAVAQDQYAVDWSRPYFGVAVGSGAAAGALEGGGEEIDFADRNAFAAGAYAGVGLYEFSGSDGRGWLLSAEVSARGMNAHDAADARAYSLDGSWSADALLLLGYGWDQTRLYGGAGIAISDLAVTEAGREADDVNLGLALGFGLETALDENWSTRADARAVFVGDNDRRIGGARADAAAGAVMLTTGLTRRF